MLGALLRNERGIITLNLGGVLEHDRGEVARGEGAIDVPFKSLPAQVGQVAAMVNMRVTQHHRRDLLGVKREIPVPFDGFAPVALKQPAFQQQLLPIEFQQILRTRRRTGRAEKMDAHCRKHAENGYRKSST